MHPQHIGKTRICAHTFFNTLDSRVRFSLFSLVVRLLQNSTGTIRMCMSVYACVSLRFFCLSTGHSKRYRFVKQQVYAFAWMIPFKQMKFVEKKAQLQKCWLAFFFFCSRSNENTKKELTNKPKPAHSQMENNKKPW